jgi:hypothetical protein
MIKENSVFNKINIFNHFTLIREFIVIRLKLKSQKYIKNIITVVL